MRETSLHVLFVEDNPGDARLLEESLTEEAGDIFRLTWVKDLETAVGRLETELVDAVLLDLNLPDSQGFDTFARMKAECRDVPVLVLTGLDDDQAGLRAIQEGAQDYLAKADLSGEKVARALRYAVERNRTRVRELRKFRPARSGKAVAFLGVKGGVGASSVVLNVAAAAAKNTRHMVSAVELRPDFGSFAVHLREAPLHSLATLMRLDPSTVSDSILDKCLLRSRLGFDVLFAPRTLADHLRLDHHDTRVVVDRLTSRADIVLLDIPPRYEPWVEAAISVCDLAVLVTERDPASVAAAKSMLHYLHGFKAGPSRIGMIVVNRSLMIDGATPKQLENELGCELFGVVPPAPEVAASAQRCGNPVVVHRPLSAPASMLAGIAEKILRRLDLAGAARPRLHALSA